VGVRSGKGGRVADLVRSANVHDLKARVCFISCSGRRKRFEM